MQKEARRVALTKDMKKIGLSFSIDHDIDAITFIWSRALSVMDTGTINDVLPVGDYPIHLSLSEQVTVRFEPRSLGDWSERHRVGNRKFADLKKGDLYEFHGVTRYGRCYVKQGLEGSFVFDVEARGLAAFFGGLLAAPGQ